MANVKLTEEDFKKLLEEEYKEWYKEDITDDYGFSLSWQALLAIEEIYVEIFGKEAFDEFIKGIRNGR